MRFTKMQGIGNDYIYLDCVRGKAPENPSGLSRKISDRHFGAGSDGLVLICPSEHADFRMAMFNADGSESEMCGNASRCIGKYVYERGLTDKKELSLLTKGGIRQMWLTTDEDTVVNVRVDMGSPELSPRLIPVDLPGEMVLRHRLQMMGQSLFLEVIDLPMLGPMIEHHPLFPRRVNVEFVRAISREVLQMRVWERGAGETLACGTGACAALVAGVLTGMCDRSVQMKLPGGNLQLQWNASDNHVYMSGPAEFVFDGEWRE